MDLLSFVFQTVDIVRSSRTIFIAEIDGLVIGAVNEISVQKYMRFAGPKPIWGRWKSVWEFYMVMAAINS